MVNSRNAKKDVLLSRFRIKVWYNDAGTLVTSHGWPMVYGRFTIISMLSQRCSPRCTAFSIASRLYHRGNARFTVREGRGDGNGQDHSFLAQLLCQPFLKNVIGQILVLVDSLNLYKFDSVIGNMMQVGTGKRTRAKANRWLDLMPA